MIDYEVISYNGQKRTFTTTEEGQHLLDIINKEKREENKDINDIIITFECE